MIQYVNWRLISWAKWKLSNRQTLENMLGVKSSWPSLLGRAESTETVAQHGSVVPTNDLECYETDQAVMVLPLKLKETVVAFYTRKGTTQELAAMLGVNQDTVFERIHRAHQHILGSLNDLAAGISLKPDEELKAA